MLRKRNVKNTFIHFSFPGMDLNVTVYNSSISGFKNVKILEFAPDFQEMTMFFKAQNKELIVSNQII